jgi:aminomethyltransferase
VNQSKGDFRGKQAVIASEGKERFLAAGISVDHDDALGGGELLKLDGAEVGVINSPCWSHRLNKSLALVHLRPTASQPGTRLEVSGDNFSGTATVEATPFFDAGKSRTHA